MPLNLESAIPTEYIGDPTTAEAEAQHAPEINFRKVESYIAGWRNVLQQRRQPKRAIWDDCWALYRGKEDFCDKEDWQSKIALPKAWASVKQVTSVLRRYYSAAHKPWRWEAVNPEDTATAIRGERKTDLTKAFLEAADYETPFFEAVENGNIMGLAVCKLWWGFEPRPVIGPGPTGAPVRSEVLEGRLFVRSVDPYNFYWLPGSRLNHWAGTIEEIEIPIWQLQAIIDAMTQAGQGAMLNPDAVRNLNPSRINEWDRQSALRHDDIGGNSTAAPTPDADLIKVTEYYGPIFQDDQMLYRNGHGITVNGNALFCRENPYWHTHPPYVAWSPLSVPFRTEGSGLIEPVREVLRQYSKITNMAVDTISYSLMPIFEVFADAYENPEDFETGLTPGKIFRKKAQYANLPVGGINQIPFQDVSGGAIQVAAILDRSFQEGVLVSEIQQGIPRFRGVQTATEIEAKAENQQSFFGALATDMEKNFILPMINMAGDLVSQYINTTGDPRVVQILGLADTADLAGMSHEQILQEIHGDFTLRVTGISEQLEKAEMLNNLVQFMNILGQNPTAWLPYIDQTQLLKRIVEAFRPAIHDVDKIVVPPDRALQQMNQQIMQNMTPDVVAMLPQIIQMALDQQNAQQQMVLENQMRQQELAAQAAAAAAKPAAKE